MKTILASLLLAYSALAQTSLTSTTTSAAVAIGDIAVNVTSATGISAKTLQTNTVLYMGREAMRVTTATSTLIGVERGADGTAITAHASGERVWIGPPTAFAAYAPIVDTPCTLTSVAYIPRIVLSTGFMYGCSDSTWQVYTGNHVNLGTPNTGVTAQEYGDNRHHVTYLTFTDLAMFSSTGGAALGVGKLIYTLPANAVVVKSSSISLALEGASTTVDSDTPVVGLGTVIGSGVVSVLSGTATFVNIMAGVAMADVHSAVKLNTVGTVLAIEAAGTRTVYLNAAATWTGAAAITGTGTVVLEWILLK